MRVFSSFSSSSLRRNSSSPRRMISLFRNCFSSMILTPFTKVPLRLPRSFRYTPSPKSLMRLCFLETEGACRIRLHSVLRPMRISFLSTGIIQWEFPFISPSMDHFVFCIFQYIYCRFHFFSSLNMPNGLYRRSK
jgi:hypothetical protein